MTTYAFVDTWFAGNIQHRKDFRYLLSRSQSYSALTSVKTTDVNVTVFFQRADASAASTKEWAFGAALVRPGRHLRRFNMP